jgi:6-phosphogluconolactonase
VLAERNSWVAAVVGAKPEARITLTYPALESSRHAAFLVAGDDKRAIFRRLRDGDKSLPAARLRPIAEVSWFLDRAAAGAET